ncbi:MAG: T9SS type A sorting domain-containing protein, partial [Ignavibacteriaceae bacterium]|nr:T9SS type A sorting domain-containing protein [Ignavibacteriaceae bacterium]
TGSSLSQKLDSKYFQENWEVYFQFYVQSPLELQKLNSIISIDNIDQNLVRAYANEKGYNKILDMGYKIKILPHPGDVENIAMSGNLKSIEQWDVYPTYDAYVLMMQQFAAAYPNLCRIVDAGTTVQGRKILFAVISDNVNQREAEPQFMYSSTIHGDETTGYVLMLRLIDYLLSNYDSDAQVTNLVNNLEIWINPDANPDGTYHGGNNTVGGARRYNANSVDLNRNFPDPAAGPHPDGNAWQPETTTMMNLAQHNNFVMSANFHGGAEVVNYPWDTWSRLHADNSWFYSISRRYADVVHANSTDPTYMTFLQNGITNGYAWYSITGGRQDYFTYLMRGREVTIEISDTKLLSASQLPAHWNYNRLSFLQYMENALYGIKGSITDTAGNPVKAYITVNGHDFDHSEIYSDSSTGAYVRMLSPGTYTLTITADSFYTQTISNLVVANLNATNLNMQLVPNHPVPVELTSFTANAANGKVFLNWATATETNNKGFEVQRQEEKINVQWTTLGFVASNGTTTEKHDYIFIDDNVTGKVKYRLKQTDYDGTFKFSNEVEVEIVPAVFEVEQNYPNPFNPVTTIKYSVPSTEFVTISVYNLLGQKLAALVNEVKTPGNYKIDFDASKLSSGIYIYRFESGGFVKANKMTLLK